jgi:hypothetical protein
MVASSMQAVRKLSLDWVGLGVGIGTLGFARGDWDQLDRNG